MRPLYLLPIIIAAGLAFYGFTAFNDATSPASALPGAKSNAITNAIAKITGTDTALNTPSANNSDSTAPSGASPTGAESRKTYVNEEFDFMFTYPESLGDIHTAVKNATACGGSGQAYVSNFSGNTASQFGFTTKNYRPCEGTASIFEVTKYENGEGTLLLTLDSTPQTVPLLETLPTTNSSINAYVIKNPLSSTETGYVALVQGPNAAIGPLIFTSENQNYALALEHFKNIISQ